MKWWRTFMVFMGMRSECCYAKTYWDDSYGKMYCKKCGNKL